MNAPQLDRAARGYSRPAFLPGNSGFSQFAYMPQGLPAAVDLSSMRLRAHEKSGLNWGILKSGVLQALYLAAIGSGMTAAAAQAHVVAVCADKPDAYFHPADLEFAWSAVQVSDPEHYDNGLAAWAPERMNSNWGARFYQARLAAFLDSLFYVLGGQGDDGHAIYCNLAGRLYVLGCAFDLLGGQALQVVNRDSKFKDGECQIENRPLEQDPEVVVAGCSIGRTGMADARGSFPISLFDVGRPGHPLRASIVNNLIVCDWGMRCLEKESKAWARSRGGILVEGRGKDAHHNGAVTIARNHVELEAPDRQALVAMNCESLLVQGNTFITHGGSKYVDVDRVEFEGDEGILPSGNVVWRKNAGNATLRYRGEVLGPCSGTYRMQEGKVAYRRLPK